MKRQSIDEAYKQEPDEKGRERMKKRIEEKYGVSSATVARSILSRPIDGYFLGDGQKHVMIAAAHHALEYITINLTFALIDELLSKSQKGEINSINCKILLSKYRFIILPCVNPDGVELHLNGIADTPLKDRQLRLSNGDFSTWQANARGVDLNHNYAAGFSRYKGIEAERGISAGCSLYSGEFPESEPETHGVANLVRTLMPIAVVSLHSQGREIYPSPRTPSVLRTADRISSLSGYNVSEPRDTAMYGGLCDYTGSLGIPSFTLEVGAGVNPLPLSGIDEIFSDVSDAVLTLPTML